MKQKLVNIIGILVPLLFFVVLVGSLLKSIQRARNATSLIEKTKEKLEKAKQEERQAQDQLAITQSEAYLEAQLRDKLGLAKEGEIVLVLPPDEELKKLAPQLDQEEEIKPKPNYQKWLDLFD